MQNISGVHIRNYNPADYGEVKKLLVDGSLYYEPMDSEERLQEKISKDPSSILVAVQSEKIVGTVRIMEDGSTPFIFRLAVESENRNQGIGKALMEKAEKELFRRGYTEINILVEDKDEELKQYYERQGYEQGNIYRWMTKERR